MRPLKFRSLATWAALAAITFGLTTHYVVRPVRAQELKDELDALDDVPSDDLTGMKSKGSATKKSASSEATSSAADKASKTDSLPKETPATDTAKAGDAAKATDPLDDLPADDLPATAADKTDKTNQATDSAKEMLADKPEENAQDKAAEKTADATLPPPNDTPPADDAVESLGANGKESDAGLEQELRTLDDKTDTKKGPPVAALTGVEAEPTGKVTSMDFRQLPDRVRLTLKGNRVMDWTRELRSKRKQIILELRNMNLSRAVLKRALDTGEFDGPVALVQAFEAKAGSQPTVKVLFQLRQFADPTVMKNGNDLIVDFPIMTDSTIFKSRSAAQVQIPETFLSVTTKMPSTGQKISFRVKDAELQDVLNFLSQASGKNFVLATEGTSAKKVTFNVRNTPWDEVLRIILVNAGMGYQKLGNVYRIAPIKDLRDEINAAVESASKSEDLIPVETRLYALSYAKAAKVKGNVADFNTKRGKISVEERTNTLVVTDIPETLEKISRYIKSIDRQTAQILVEGRIVEANRIFTKSLGINWQYTLPRGVPAAGSFVDIGKTPNAVNNRLDASIGSLGSWGSIRAVLATEEEEKRIKTIASPRVMVQDNSTATMKQADSVLVLVAPTGAPSSAGSAVYVPPTAVNTELELQVTPQVTSDGFVLMDLTLKRETPVPNSPGSKNSREAKTQVLVESGKTIVVGGIYTTDSTKDVIGLPWFRNIPVIGAAFTNNTSITENMTELLMFISPKITNPDKAFLANIERDSRDEEDASMAQKPVSSLKDETVPDDVF
ncbi:MAG: secretin and TonB N-terminal domain-containing protein [Bdellovibrionales bacterium]|nr:secretin and TonB N-terminal domain-containing protein [Bdellovibrionales bacterium]